MTVVADDLYKSNPAVRFSEKVIEAFNLDKVELTPDSLTLSDWPCSRHSPIYNRAGISPDDWYFIPKGWFRKAVLARGEDNGWDMLIIPITREEVGKIMMAYEDWVRRRRSRLQKTQQAIDQEKIARAERRAWWP